ncbi:MAG: ABC transporter permease [Gemmatimonas sp.]
MRHLVQRDRFTRELEEELRTHVEMRADRIRQLADQSFEPLRPDLRTDQAYVAARRRFGNTTEIQQRSRDMWGLGRLEDLTNDVRFAFRRLAQRPAFAASVIGVMAIGIGATTAMFSAVDAAMLRPLPFNHPDQLVVLPAIDIPKRDRTVEDLSFGRGFDFADAVDMKRTFSAVAAYSAGALDLNDRENPTHLNAGVVSANFFQTLGVQPILGRVFLSDESKAPAPRIVVLSYGMWQRIYGGRDIAGLKITLAETPYEVVGVMPRGFSFPRESDLWIPMSIPYVAETHLAFKETYFNTTTFARLADGVSVEQASAQLVARWQQLRAGRVAKKTGDYVARTMATQGGAVRLQQKLLGDRRTALLVLLGATGLLLLVACVNVTNLLLAHGSQRAREISVRQVLGATRSRIIRQLLTESMVLAIGGALLGVLLAPLAFGAISVMMPKALVGVAPAHVDLRILAFAVMLAVITGITFGMWPAIGSVRKDSSDVIKSGGGHGSTSARGGRVRRVLVGTELALATALLIGAGLMLQSFRQLMSRETGMNTQQVGTLKFSFPQSADSSAIRSQRLEQMLERFAGQSEISAAGFVNDLPLAGTGLTALRIKVPGGPVIKSDDPSATMARLIEATQGYFEAMGIKLVQGRLFTKADVASGAHIAVIGRRMEKTYWPDRDAIGRTFTRGMDSVLFTVIGVVEDVREESLEDDPMMQTYFPMNSTPPNTVTLIARSRMNEQALLARMTAVVRSVDKTQAVFNARMMNDVLDLSVSPRRTNTLLINTFALLALALASVGIYAVVSYGVSHRSRELGIRSALGATGSSLMRMISREMVWVVIAGVGVGLAGAWALAKTMESLVYGIDVHDLRTFVIVPLSLIVPVVVATLIPARKVLSVDPAQVMRAD